MIRAAIIAASFAIVGVCVLQAPAKLRADLAMYEEFRK